MFVNFATHYKHSYGCFFDTARVLVTPFILEWNPTPTPLEKKEWNPLLHSILISKGVNPPLHSPLQQKY